MLNQVYTSHLHAQLNHPGSNQVQSHNSSKGSSQMFGNNNQSGQTAFGKSYFLYTPGPRLMQFHLVRNSTSAKFEKSHNIYLVRPIIHLVQIFALSD